MKKENQVKTHFRRVYKSDHLGVADLEDFIEQGSNLIFNIERVQQEYDVKVSGKTGNHNILYFKEKVKPLVLNAGNAKALSKLSESSFVEDWKDLRIQLFIDHSAKFAGQIVGGVRIRDKAPAEKPKYSLTPGCEKWEAAKESVKSGMTIEEMRKHFEISDDHYKELSSVA